MSYYHVGAINEGGMEIKWGEKRALFEGLISNIYSSCN
jgi:hypothetical protein